MLAQPFGADLTKVILALARIVARLRLPGLAGRDSFAVGMSQMSLASYIISRSDSHASLGLISTNFSLCGGARR